MKDTRTVQVVPHAYQATAIACAAMMVVIATMFFSGCTRSDSDERAVAPATPQHDSAILPQIETPPTQQNDQDTAVFEHAGLRIPLALGSQTGQRSTSSMRAAEWTLPAAEVADAASGSEDATLIVFYFGDTGAGTVEANIARWLGQIAQPDGSDSRDAATITDHEVNGMQAMTVDVAGTYVAETFPGSGERMNKLNWRLVATIVHSPAGPYYFRLLGPKPIVEGWHDSYSALLANLQPAQETRP